MSPLRFFELYSAMVLHFKDGSSYDFFKYGGKTRVTANSLLKRNDKYFFEKWAKRWNTDDEAICFLFTNFLYENKTYIRSLTESNLTTFISFKDAFDYKFKNSVETWHNGKGQLAINSLIEACFSGSTEAFMILTIISETVFGGDKMITQLDKIYSSNILWDDLKRRIKKFGPFITKYLNIQSEESVRKVRNIYKEALQTL